MKTYIIQYTVSLTGKPSIMGKMKCKNRPNEFVAKVKFEEYLRKKHPEFSKLIIHSCREESELDDLFSSLFGKIFK